MIARELTRPWRLTTGATLLINFLLTAAYALAVLAIANAKSPPTMLHGSDWRFKNHLDAVRAGDTLVLSVTWVAVLTFVTLAHIWSQRAATSASLAEAVRSGLLATSYVVLSPVILDPTNIGQDIMGVAIMGGLLAALFAAAAVVASRGLGVYILVGLAGTAAICAFTDAILGFGFFCC